MNPVLIAYRKWEYANRAASQSNAGNAFLAGAAWQAEQSEVKRDIVSSLYIDSLKDSVAHLTASFKDMEQLFIAEAQTVELLQKKIDKLNLYIDDVESELNLLKGSINEVDTKL